MKNMKHKFFIMARKFKFSLFSEPLLALQCCFHYLIFIFLTVLISLIFYYSSSGSTIYYDEYHNHGGGLVSNFTTRSVVEDEYHHNHGGGVFSNFTTRSVVEEGDFVSSLAQKKCDFYSGKWVFDNSSTLLYKDNECKFMFDDLACQKYGRKDLDYQKWRWQPHDCDLPRFNATAMLEKLRNKRLVFVGDSVNRNQWVSLMCMLEGSVPTSYKSMKLKGNLYTFKATNFNTTIDFYWAPMLVESKADNPSSHHLNGRVIKVNSIEKHASRWRDADVLVFNSYLWWIKPEVELVWGSFESPKKVKKVSYPEAYRMGLKTWSNYITTHFKYSKTKLFFMGMSATHIRADDWGKRKDQNCLKETQIITKQGHWGSRSDKNMLHILEEEIKGLKSKGSNIQFLNITQLTEYRKDAHPSIYRKQWRPLSKEQLSNPFLYADCTHWCLPGVPDLWNHLLYAHLL